MSDGKGTDAQKIDVRGTSTAPDVTLEAVEEYRLVSLTWKDSMEARWAQIDRNTTRLNALERQLDAIEQQLARIKAQLDPETMGAITKAVSETQAKQQVTRDAVTGLIRDLAELKGRIDDVQVRMDDAERMITRIMEAHGDIIPIRSADDDETMPGTRLLSMRVLEMEEDEECTDRWIAADALAMANAFRAFVAAGADQMSATDLVRMWLEKRKERDGND